MVKYTLKYVELKCSSPKFNTTNLIGSLAGPPFFLGGGDVVFLFRLELRTHPYDFCVVVGTHTRRTATW